jgi:hypothetical protein
MKVYLLDVYGRGPRYFTDEKSLISYLNTDDKRGEPINRYQITGNDTNMLIKNTTHHGENIIKVVDQIISKLNYKIIKQGTHDDDRGRYFNFVQPLTWIYGSHVTDKSN